MEEDEFNPGDFNSVFDDTNPSLWESFNVRENGYVDFTPDPDTESPKLVVCHEAAWNCKPINKNGESMGFKIKSEGKNYKKYYLTWGKFTFSSDIIVTDCSRYVALKDKYLKEDLDVFREIIKQVKKEAKERTKKFYTGIGNFIIFPTIANSFNMVRGKSPFYDRFDLALEYIRIYYQRQKKGKVDDNENYIDETVYEKLFKAKDVHSNEPVNQIFFDKFDSFKGYIEFFCLQDWVDKDYSHVRDLVKSELPKKADREFLKAVDEEIDWGERCWVNEKSFEHPFPKSMEAYKRWIKNQQILAQRRTKKIKKAYQASK